MSTVAELRSTTAVRERAGQLLCRARAGESDWFRVCDARLDDTADLVSEVTRRRYPDLNIPYHSRWRHFEVGAVDRTAALAGETDPFERTRTMIDLVVISVLLDAGAGPDWRYVQPRTGQRFSRSEGLAVASWYAFLDGLFSSDPRTPRRADAAGLRALTSERLAAAFQVSADNPVVGLAGRVELLHRLADALEAQAVARPAALFDRFLGAEVVDAHDVLSVILACLSSIWLVDNMIDGVGLGDCWLHRGLGDPGWMPFHKLSQWLCYSLLEPLEFAGARVDNLGALTGLPEYRNGGLLLDTGVLELCDGDDAGRPWSVSDEVIVEWRALTVALLDDLAPLVGGRLGVPDLPLARVLEGGTWAAGRITAQQLRGGLPPLIVLSDGTVF